MLENIIKKNKKEFFKKFEDQVERALYLTHCSLL
jgi:hypothetical protein